MYICTDCHCNYYVFMVHDYLWFMYGHGEGDTPCPVCFGKRMGRELRLSDLNDAPCNHMYYPTEVNLRFCKQSG